MMNIVFLKLAMIDKWQDLHCFGDIFGLPLKRTIRAVGYAFFELLQLLGFAFLHPLKPATWLSISYFCWWYVDDMLNLQKKSSFLTSLRARFITYCFLSNPLTWIIQRWQEKSLRFILMFFDYNTHWMCMSHLVGSFEVSWFSSMLGYFGHIFPCLNW